MEIQSSKEQKRKLITKSISQLEWLDWHEIVNDVIQGEPVLVTYCPLCGSGIAYVSEIIIDGKKQVSEFGTSGKLYNSNLVMYDRKTDSLWSQVLAEAVVGEMTGAKLKIISSDQMRYQNWKEQFPQGEVLSRDTGVFKQYGEKPYGDYFQTIPFALSLAGVNDGRLTPEEFVFGVIVNGKAKAYLVNAVKEEGVVEDTFEGENFVLTHDKKLDVVRMTRMLEDGLKERVNPVSGFWFSWAAAHPETQLYSSRRFK